MAITQSAGNLSVVPQAPQVGDPLGPMKAFAVGTQLGQELAGLTLAGDKLKFEKAKLKAAEEGLKFEQSLARMKLQTAAQQLDSESKLAPFKLRAAEAEATVRESEARMAGTPWNPPGVSAPAAPAAAPSLAAEKVNVPEAALTEVPQGVATPAAEPKTASPTFSDTSRNPLLRIEENFAGADPVALAQQRAAAEYNAVASTLPRPTSVLSAAKNPEIAAAFSKAYLGARDKFAPKQDVLEFVDDRGIPFVVDVVKVGNDPVKQLGPARVNAAKLPKAQQAFDEAFVKSVTEGGAGNAAQDAANIAQVEGVIAELGKGDVLTGPIVSLLPDALRARIPGLDRGIAVQQSLEQVVAQSLRSILGGQFAMREGENLLKRAFDPRQSEQENIRRATVLLTTLKSAQAAKQQQLDYFRANNTLAGFDGPSAEDLFRQTAAEVSGQKPATVAPGPVGDPVQDMVMQGLEKYLGGG